MRDALESLSQSTEGSTMNAVSMRGAEDVGAGFMDGSMDEEAGLVDLAVAATGNDLTCVVGLDEIRGLDQGKMSAKWIKPECGGVHRVLIWSTSDICDGNPEVLLIAITYSDCDVATSSLAEPCREFQFSLG